MTRFLVTVICISAAVMTGDTVWLLVALAFVILGGVLAA